MVEDVIVMGKNAKVIKPISITDDNLIIPGMVSATAITSDGVAIPLRFNKFPDTTQHISYGVISSPAAMGMAFKLAGSAYRIYPVNTEAGATETYKTYLHTTTGTNVNTREDALVLPDMIDVSTMTITNSNPALIDITGLEDVRDGYNTMGFVIKVKDLSKPATASIEFSFTDKGTGQKYTTYQMIIIDTPTPPGKIYEVDSVSEFKAAYLAAKTTTVQAEADTIVLAEGTYAMDIYHDRCVNITAAENAVVKGRCGKKLFGKIYFLPLQL